MRSIGALLTFLFGACAFAATPVRPVCVGAAPAGRFRLEASRPAGGGARALTRMNLIQSGYSIRYEPVELTADVKKDAKVALLVAPPATAEGPAPQLTLLEIKPAGSAGVWTAPFRIGLVVLAFGPQGLDDKRINNLAGKDFDLFSDLADYAEKTAEVESTLNALNALDDDEDIESQEDAPRPDRSSPTEQALIAMLRLTNPAASAYNPLGPGRRVGPVTLMGKATTGFFDNAGGLFFGGGALGELKPMLFPDVDFRAAFLQQAGSGPALTLCAQRVVARSRNRQVFLWARRIVDASAPGYSLASTPRIPIGARSYVALHGTHGGEWKLTDRVEEWTLAPVAGGDSVPAPVRPTAQGRFVEIDLREFKGKPGAYRLQGRWDWETVEVTGQIELTPLGNLKAARLSPESAGRMVEAGGLATVSFTGPNFEFVDKVTLRRADNRFSHPQEVEFALPRGRRGGAQDRLDVDLDLNRLRAGAYTLALFQADARPQDVPLVVAPAPAPLEIRAFRVNQGTAEQRVVLRGIGLDRIERIELGGAQIRLEPKSRDGSERAAVVTLRDGAKKGDRLDCQVKLDGDGAIRQLPQVIEVLGPRPRIVSIKAVTPADLGVALRPGELPAGFYVNVAIKLENSDPPMWLALGCSGAQRPAVRLRAGEKDRSAAVYASAGGDLFLAMDPGIAGAGCTLSVTAESESSGASEPVAIGAVVRTPRIESLTLTDEKQSDGSYSAILKGYDLETIEKTGWDAATGLPSANAPAPVAGEGQKQTLRIAVPWPSPTPRGPLYIWLRGEKEARATTAKY